MSRVVIGMDPHKRSATIEAIDEREKVLTQGRFRTDADGYQQMLEAGRAFTDRVWAVEGCSGIGRHVAQRLVADGDLCSTCRRSCRHESESSTPARAARPTRSTHTASRSPVCAARTCAG